MLDFINVFKGFITFDFFRDWLLLTLKTVSSIRLQYQISTSPFRWFLRAAERVCEADGRWEAAPGTLAKHACEGNVRNHRRNNQSMQTHRQAKYRAKSKESKGPERFQ